MPTTPAAVTTVSAAPPTLPATSTIHVSEVADDHDVVPQVCRPADAVADWSAVRKVSPESVTLPPSVATRLSRVPKLTTGAREGQVVVVVQA